MTSQMKLVVESIQHLEDLLEVDNDCYFEGFNLQHAILYLNKSFLNLRTTSWPSNCTRWAMQCASSQCVPTIQATEPLRTTPKDGQTKHSSAGALPYPEVPGLALCWGFSS